MYCRFYQSKLAALLGTSLTIKTSYDPPYKGVIRRFTTDTYCSMQPPPPPPLETTRISVIYKIKFKWPYELFPHKSKSTTGYIVNI